MPNAFVDTNVLVQISHWDSLILASARELNCAVIYSEDLNHGQDFDGVKVINPFR